MEISRWLTQEDFMRTLAAVGVFVCAAASTVAPAEAQRLEFGAGGGYAFGGGVEDPGPSLATLDASVAVWPLTRWGVAVRRVVGPGEDLRDPPIVSRDRTYLGQGDLRYWTVTTRFRRPIGSSLGLQLGLGLQKSGRFSTVWILDGQRRTAPTAFFDGAALGVTVESNLETTNVHPVLLAVVGF
jgi:hypothetical protein